MNDSLEFVKPSVREISSYYLQDRSSKFKLNQNENPYDIPMWLKDEVFAEFRALPWNRYPSFRNEPLIGKLSKYVQVASECLLVGNGSNELLQMLTSIVLSKDKKLLLVTPTFQIYEQLGRIAEGEIYRIDFEDDWSFPVEKILGALREETFQLCIFCSPNSPTGSTLHGPDLIEVLATTNGLVVVDEAYCEFSRKTFLKLQKEYGNLILTRTFSKAMGLAGLRIGYLIAHPRITREIIKAKLPYNLNIFSEFVATKLLNHRHLIQENINRIMTEKERLLQELLAMERVQVFPSQANFFMIETPMHGTELFERLLRHGVLVRDISKSHPRLRNKVRICVGTPSENDELIKALQLCLS